VPVLNRAATRVSARIAATGRRTADELERHGLRAGEIRVPLPNGAELCLWSDGNDAMASHVWWRGWDGYQPEAVRPWFALASQAGAVLDVGANIGVFALLAARANAASRCWAFEPVPPTVANLEENIRRNPGANVTAVPVAVGASSGSTQVFWDPIVVNDELAGLTSDHHQSGAELASATVPVVALDDWHRSADVERIDLVKIDVETLEPAVLSGMAGILERDKPDLVIEVLDQATVEAVDELVGRHGYRHHLLTPAGPILTPLVGRHPSCLNHLLTVRPDRELAALWR
jgi:FkbM family methyltransferase